MKPNLFTGLPSGTSAPADAGTGVHSPTAVAEIVTFRLKDGMSDEAFVRAAGAIGPALHNSGEVISRALSCDEDGLWTDHIIWTSMKAAKEAATKVMQLPEFQPMCGMIDEASVKLRHAPVLMQMD